MVSGSAVSLCCEKKVPLFQLYRKTHYVPHKDIIMYHHAQREVPFCGLYSKSFLDLKNGALELVSFYDDDAQFISHVSLKIMCVEQSKIDSSIYL